MTTQEAWTDWQEMEATFWETNFSATDKLAILKEIPEKLDELDALWRAADTAMRFGDVRRVARYLAAIRVLLAQMKEAIG